MTDAIDTIELAKPKRTGGTTLAISVYSRLREDILNATLTPGLKLKIRDLCVHYNVGLSPIREALTRLSSEGMVVQTAQRGFTVANFSINELNEILRTKQWLNEIGLRESIKFGDMQWEENIILAFHRLARVPRYTSGEPHEANRDVSWNNAHLAFHTSLIAACRSEWLKSFCQTLFFASDRYRAVARLKGDGTKRLEEHRMIMEAAVKRDADKAVALLSEHFEKTANLVRHNLEQLAPPPAPVRKRHSR
ncbi:MAG: GntR family transcriptional regulator [Pseudolabrys sp.]|nr:GntR family transcriptional regulator [Pseudolabrys sp.]